MSFVIKATPQQQVVKEEQNLNEAFKTVRSLDMADCKSTGRMSTGLIWTLLDGENGDKIWEAKPLGHANSGLVWTITDEREGHSVSDV